MKNNDKRIVSARITAMPTGLFDPMPRVYVRLDGAADELFLFEYYPDEIAFQPEEFIGLTQDEAHGLKFKKDRDWLRS